MKTRIMLFIVMLLAAWQGATAQDYFKDTVWTKRTDQMQGFYMVKFSNTDSLIIGHGMEMDLFYDAKTGKEVMRIPGNNEVFFINNDRNFIKLNYERNCFEIFDTKSYQIIDTLENDGSKIYNYSDINKEETKLISLVNNGLRIWDLTTKQVMKTKIFQKEAYQTEFNVERVRFNCDGEQIIATFYKEFLKPDNKTEVRRYHPVFMTTTLDSIDVFEFYDKGSTAFQLSNTCRYFAIKTGDMDYGVEIYDFKTKELIWKLPINGPSLTGIEFSPDDMYLVTTNWTGDYGLKIWELAPKKMIYNNKDGGFTNFDISQNGKYLITSIVRKLYLYPMKYNDTSIPQKEINDNIIIYPNPSNGIATIEFNQPLNDVTTIKLIDTNGKIAKLILKKYLESGNQSIQFKTHDLLNGSYFIMVENSHISLMFKLIVNR